MIRLPRPGETPSWTEELASLGEELKSDYWDSWTEGGCWAFATAFKAAAGGMLCGICQDVDEGCWATNHAMVLKNGIYYDATGVVDVGQACAAIATQRGVPQCILTSRHAAFEVYDDDHCDDEQWARLHDILRRHTR